jgi:hypothetical protein
MLRRLKSLFSTPASAYRNPEQAYIVTVSDSGVSCQRPSGIRESVTWDDLRAVLIETNDAGPFVSDVFWILVGEDSGCVVPLGATGEDLLLKRLQALKDFDNTAVIQAMSSSENKRFLCWGKPQLPA